MTVRLADDQAAFIDYARVARLATVDAEGQPHVVPVCHILLDGRIYVASEDNKKVRNIRTNPKVALSFGDYVEDWTVLRSLLVQGVVSGLIEKGPAFASLRQAFHTKFPQYEPQVGGVTEGETVILEIEIHKVAGEL